MKHTPTSKYAGRRFGPWAGVRGLLVVFALWGPVFGGPAQAQEREYVIGVGDQLDIQVFNQVQLLSNFSTRAEVRSDRMITMPWLGDVTAAGLKKSTLTTVLESREYLGRFLTEPHVTITPTRMAATMRVVFSGAAEMEQEIPRDIRFGQLLGDITTTFGQYEPNFETITIRSFEGEVFAPLGNLRLQWGDEIAIPKLTPTPPIASQVTPSAADIPEADRVFAEGLALLGIRTNLSAQGLQEAFLGMPSPTGELLIRRFHRGDVIRPGEHGGEDVILHEIDETARQVLVAQGAAQYPLTLAPPFSTVALVGIVSNQWGLPEAVLQGLPTADAAGGPTQRTRYAEGSEVGPGITLVKIVAAQQVAILQNFNQAVQLLFLRDPRNRAIANAFPSASSSAPSEASAPLTPEADLQRRLHQQLPAQLQALDTLSQLFFATPLF